MYQGVVFSVAGPTSVGILARSFVVSTQTIIADILNVDSPVN